MKLSPDEVYKLLVNEDRILEINGQIKFFLGNIDIIVKQKDVVGNIMQEWVQGWLEYKGVEYALSANSQMPPDFFLNRKDKTVDLLEVKAFNRNASPGFDIADFRMYVDEIVEKPYMLDVDYLIFGYDMSDEGIVTIQDVWLKKVWEITRRMKNWPVNLQVKDNVVHKIRPAVWYSTSRVEFSVFESMEDFISAIEETVHQNPDTRDRAGQWLNRFIENYEKHYGVRLDIPRWRDIADNYIIKKTKPDKPITKVSSYKPVYYPRVELYGNSKVASESDSYKEKRLLQGEKEEVCGNCGQRFIWTITGGPEGHKTREEIACPHCGNVVDSVMINGIVSVRKIEQDD